MNEEAAAENGAADEPQESAELQHAPEFPWEIVLTAASTFFHTTADGTVFLKFAPLGETPMGTVMLPPGVVIRFSRDGWEHFQKEVAAGKKIPRPRITTALVVPGSPPQG